MAGTNDVGPVRSTGSAPVSVPSATRPAASAAARVANTSPSSKEFDANRFAPCTPEHAASPTAYSPRTVERPLSSVRMPPE